MKQVYILTNEHEDSLDGGTEIIAVFETEDEAFAYLDDYKKSNGYRTMSGSYEVVTGYRVRNYTPKEVAESCSNCSKINTKLCPIEGYYGRDYSLFYCSEYD